MPTNTTEFHIQKRGLAVWQYVTWYETYDEAKKNFDRLVMGKGYSYRIVELKVMDEAKLEGEREDEVPDGDIDNPFNPAEFKKQATEEKTAGRAEAPKSSWGAPTASGWGKPISEADIKPEHGLTGSVWVGNPVTKEKRRVAGFEANRMLTEGWIKVGPRTVL